VVQGFSDSSQRHPFARYHHRVFSALDPEELEKGFVAWVSSIASWPAGEVVAIDGKTLRGAQEPSKKGPDKKGIVQMLFGWAKTNSLGARPAARVDEVNESRRFQSFLMHWS